MKPFLLILGFLAALLIVAQFVMAMLILSNPADPKIRTMHQHSGYLTAAVVLLYIGFSLARIAALPGKSEPR